MNLLPTICTCHGAGCKAVYWCVLYSFSIIVHFIEMFTQSRGQPFQQYLQMHITTSEASKDSNTITLQHVGCFPGACPTYRPHTYSL